LRCIHFMHNCCAYISCIIFRYRMWMLQIYRQCRVSSSVQQTDLQGTISCLMLMMDNAIVGNIRTGQRNCPYPLLEAPRDQEARWSSDGMIRLSTPFHSKITHDVINSAINGGPRVRPGRHRLNTCRPPPQRMTHAHTPFQCL
jgi:hypothetical protein